MTESLVGRIAVDEHPLPRRDGLALDERRESPQIRRYLWSA